MGQAGLGPGLVHPGGPRGDHRLFLGGAGIDIADGGDQGLQIGLGLGQFGAGVGVIEADQNLAGLDALVVGDQNRDDIATDLGTDEGGVGLDEGIVGGLPALVAQPPDGAADDDRKADQNGDDQRQALFQSGGDGHG